VGQMCDIGLCAERLEGSCNVPDHTTFGMPKTESLAFGWELPIEPSVKPHQATVAATFRTSI